MNFILAIIYGIIEGITEWIPVSSTGHLIIAESFLRFNGLSDNFWKFFEVVIQLGAILAVVTIYFKNIWPLKKEKKIITFDKEILNLWGKIIVACIPAIVIAVLKIDELADEYFYNPLCISIMLILVGIVFIIIETYNKKKSRVNDIKNLTYKDAIIIGIFQLIAGLFPGISRSGATIIGALLLGISRVVAAEYTFYLAIPTMFGASLLKLLKYGLSLTSTEIILVLIGSIVAYVVSIIIIRFFMNYIKKHDFKIFGGYRIIIGLIVLSLSLLNII